MAIAVTGCDGDLAHQRDELFLDAVNRLGDERFPRSSFEAGPRHPEGAVEFVNRPIALDAQVGLGDAPSEKEAGGAAVASFGCDGHKMVT